MNKFTKVVKSKTNNASKGSLAFQQVGLGMVKMAMSNGLTGWSKVCALQNVSNQSALSKLNSFVR
jgi:hypothetical protein